MGKLIIGLFGKLTGPVSWLLSLLLDFIWGKVVAWWTARQKDKHHHEEAKAQAADQVESAKKAEKSDNEKEVDDAIDDISKRF